MDARDIAKGNGVSLSIEPLVYMSPVTTNWGVPMVPMLIALDPQVSVVTAPPERSAELELGPVGRGARRRRMAELADEFATMHDELLRDLAR